MDAMGPGESYHRPAFLPDLSVGLRVKRSLRLVGQLVSQQMVPSEGVNLSGPSAHG